MPLETKNPILLQESEQYILVEDGECPVGRERVHEWEECADAAAFFETTGDNFDVNNANRPYGCYLWPSNGRVYRGISKDGTGGTPERKLICSDGSFINPKYSCLGTYKGASECQTTGEYAGSPSKCKPNHKPRSFKGYANWNCSICEDNYIKNNETGECEIDDGS